MRRLTIASLIAAFAFPAHAQPVLLDQVTAGRIYSFLKAGGTRSEGDMLAEKLRDAANASQAPPATPPQPAEAPPKP